MTEQSKFLVRCKIISRRAAILDCRVIHKMVRCITGNVFERPPAQEGLSSTILNNSKNLPSSSQGLRSDTAETARKRERNSESIVEYILTSKVIVEC